MARRSARPQPDQTLELPTLTRSCPECGASLWAAYKTQRTVTTLDGVVRLRLQVRRCRTASCPRRAASLRPEQEGRYALPEHEFGLDIIALIGTLRQAQHRSVPEIHAELTRRGVPLCLRTVTNLLDRYDELLALSLADTQRLRRVTAAAGGVILAIDGLQPDVGHEVLWVLRDCLSGEVLLARSLSPSTRDDLARLITEVKEALEVPITGAISDGRDSIRKAVREALDGVPHQLCHFHYLREAAKPIYEADRHAKKELKKRVRGVRPIERKVAGRSDPEAVAIQGYCAAARGALTGDGRPPLSAPGLVLKERLAAVVESLDRVEEKRGCRANSPGYGRSSRGACRRRRRSGRRWRRPTAGCSGPRRSWPTWRGGAAPR
jgi:hypothetical protein